MTLAVHQGDPPSDLYKVLHRVADRMEPKYRRAFLDALEEARDQIDVGALETAIRRKDAEAVLRSLRFEQWSREFEANLSGPQRRTMFSSGEAVAQETASELNVAFSFDATDPNMVFAARTETAKLVRQVTNDTRLAIRAIVGDMFASGVTTDEGARRIRDVVGLTERQGRAVNNFREQLQELRRLGVDADTADIAKAVDRRLDAATKQQVRAAARKGELSRELIEDVTETYRKSMNTYRAKNISRTETIRAAHIGQDESWRQADRQGALDLDEADRVWIVTPDDGLCPICAPMEGATRDKETGLFTSPFNGQSEPYPPIHSRCRCSVGLDFGGTFF